IQAEDGIRARNVTGVQTCALPILTLEIALHHLTCSLHLLASNFRLTVYTSYTNVDRRYHSSLKFHSIHHRTILLIYLDCEVLTFSLSLAKLLASCKTPFTHCSTMTSCDPRGDCSIFNPSHGLS